MHTAYSDYGKGRIIWKWINMKWNQRDVDCEILGI